MSLAGEGPAHEKKYRAELDTKTERDAMEIADLAYRHAERQSRALEAKLRAFQSVGRQSGPCTPVSNSGVGA